MVEVRLIEVSVIERYIGPVNVSFTAFLQITENALKTMDAAEQFGRNPNFITEHLNQAPAPDSNLISQCANGHA